VRGIEDERPAAALHAMLFYPANDLQDAMRFMRNPSHESNAKK
jgi:hypothetical protein